MSNFVSSHPVIWAFLCLALVSIPQWAQSVWGLFSSRPLVPLLYEKLKPMKIPNFSFQWVVNVIAIMALIYICIVVKSNNASVSSSPVMASGIPEAIQEYEEFCRTNYDSLFIEGIKAFNSKRYAYTSKLFDRGIENTSDGSWEWTKPYYFAAKLGQNPTSDGYLEFDNNLQKQLADARRGGTYYGNPGFLGELIHSYMAINLALPTNEQTNVESMISQINDIKKSLQH